MDVSQPPSKQKCQWTGLKERERYFFPLRISSFFRIYPKNLASIVNENSNVQKMRDWIGANAACARLALKRTSLGERLNGYTISQRHFQGWKIQLAIQTWNQDLLTSTGLNHQPSKVWHWRCCPPSTLFFFSLIVFVLASSSQMYQGEQER